MNRYERIKAISKRLCQDECPVIFEKGALLKDNKFNKNVLQLQFRNVGKSKIKAVYISILCLDIEKNTVETIEQKYIDLNVNYYDTFGDSVAIQLNDSTSREFEIFVQKIIFSDDSVKKFVGKMIAFGDDKNLDELGNLKSQFLRETKKINSLFPILEASYPMENLGIWKCICGSLNHSENIKCGKCNVRKDEVFCLINIDYLNEKKKEYLKQKEIEEAEKKAKEAEIKLQEEQRAEQKRNTERKIIKVLQKIIIIGTVLVIAYWVSALFIAPFIKYSFALNKIENGSYEEGYKILEELGDYKDSSDQILAGKYKQGVEFINNKEYRQGYEILEALGNYSDASDKVREGKYLEAVECLESENYVESVDLFKELGDYSDSEEKLKEATYQYAKELMENEEYEHALNQFENIYDYLDSKELFHKCCYEYAEYCMKLKNYDNAIYYYERSENFPDVDTKLIEAMYQYVKTYLSPNNGKTARYIELLSEKNYKDSRALMEKLYKLEVSIVVNASETNAAFNSDSLSKFDKWCFHIRITNGEIGKKYVLKYKLHFPDGEVKQNISDPMTVGNSDGIVGYYSENAYLGATGMATLKVYDSSDNLLAEKTVSIY